MKKSRHAHRPGPVASRPVVEALAPRILLSADLPGLVADAADAQDPADSFDVQAWADSQTWTAPIDGADTGDALTADSAAGPGGEPATLRELIVIDGAVDDYQQLVLDITTRETDGLVNFQVFVLDPGRDGVEQITTLLADSDGLAAVHILSHGADGTLQLGSTRLDLQGVAARADLIGAWSDAFTLDGDLLLYGCNLAATAEGVALVDALATLTGADVAASDDATGSAEQGGDWDLEVTTGAIESAVVVGADAQAAYQHLLDISTGLVGQWTFDTNAGDASGNGNDGTLLGNATIDTTAATNLVGAGKLSLDGVDDAVDLSAHVSSFASLTQGTIAAWVKFTATGDRTIFDIGDGAANSNFVSLYALNGRLTMTIMDGGVTILETVSTATINNGAWHHVAFTTGPSGNQLYIDGVAASRTFNFGSAATTTFISALNSKTHVTIGAYDTGTLQGDFLGTIDDVRVYNRALTASEMTQLYATSNDVPVSTGGAVTGTEDSAYVFAWSAFNVSDVDSAITASTAVRLNSLPADGTLEYFNGSTWVAASLDQVFTKSVIDAGYLRFSPDAGEAGYDGYANPGTGDGFDDYASFDFVPVQSTAVTITNPGGESQSLAEGAWNNPATGWTTSGADAGAQNPASTVFALDHDNTLYANAGATLAQTLGTTFSSTRDYSLSFEVGWRGDAGYPSEPEFRVELWAGGTRLGYVDQTAVTMVKGEFVGATLAIGGSAFAALDGQILQIRLVSVSTQTNFDNLALTSFTRGIDAGSAATMTLDIVPLNDPPVAVDDTLSTGENTPVVFDPTTNDTDPDGDAISIVEFSQPANGTVIDNGDGTLTYTPDPGYVGADSFDYAVIDTGSGVQHYWGLGGDATDAVGTADGTLNGTTSVAGSIGAGLSFNETSDYAMLPDVTYSAEFSISFDFKVDDNSGSLFQYLYSHGDINTTNSVNVFLNEAAHGTDPNVLRTVIRDGDDTLDNFALQVNVAALIGDGLWHTYTATVGANGIEVFIDGVSVATDATRGTGGVNPTGNVYLGARQDLDPSRFYGGSLDSVQVFDNALSATQIASLATDTNVATVNITVDPVNDAPTDLTPNGFSIGENIDTTGGYSLGSLATVDPDSGDTFTYTIVGGADAAKFSIGGAGGDELVLNDGVLDYERQSAYVVAVRTTDSGGLWYEENLTVTVTDQTLEHLWLTTAGDVLPTSGTAGLDAWASTTLLEVGDPNLALEPGTTDGTFAAVIDFASMVADGDATVTGLHYVSSDTLVGGSPSFQLYAGDLLVAFAATETLTSDNTLTANGNNLLVFRPTTAGDFGSGSWFRLLDNPIGTGFGGFTLIEQDTTIGDYTVTAGNFLMTSGNRDIQYVQVSGTGLGTTVTTVSRLIEGNDINLGSATNGINAIELVESTMIVGGRTLTAGQIVVALEDVDSTVGSGTTISATQYDLVVLDVTQTELGGTGLSQASASLLFEGADIGLDTTSGGASGTDEAIGAFTFGPTSALTSVNDDPVITSDGGGATASVAAAENQTGVTVVAATDVDGDIPTFAITGGADAALFSIDAATGELTFKAAPDFEQYADADFNGVYEVEVTASDGNGGSDVQTIGVTVTDVNEAPVDISFDTETGAEQVVDTYGTGAQIDPAVAAFADGGYLVVWVSDGQDGSGYGIYARRYDADGSAVGGEFLVTSEVADSETNPSVATFADGGFVVSWQDQLSGVRAWTEARVFNADGSPATAEFQVSTGTDGDNEGYQPAVVALNNSEFVVVWADETGGSSYEIAGQIYDRTGATVGAQFSVGPLLSGTGLFGAQTEVTLLDDGGFAVVWRTHDGTNLGVQARVMNADGTARSAPIVLTGDNVSDIASLSGGGFVVTYDAGGTLKAAIYDANGVLQVAGVDVNTTPSAARYESSVARSDDGFVVVWESSTGDGDGSAILAQRFDASGGRIGGEVVVNQTTAGDQQKPELVATASGELIAVWQSAGVDGDLMGIASCTVTTATAAVAEDAANGTRVADVTGVLDLDAGDTHTFSLADDAGGAFAIDANTGVITVADTTKLDYETAATMNVTVRATDSGGLSYDEVLTIQITNVNDAPVLTNGATSIANTEGSSTLPFLGIGTVTDVDSADFDGGSLTASISAGGEATDQLTLATAGGVSTSGADVLVGGVTVGTWSGGTGGTDLSVLFNASATDAEVQAVYQAIAFSTASDDPTLGVRTLSVIVTDGDGGTSNTGVATVDLNVAVNDAPAGADLTIATAEDTDYVFSLADFGITDVEGDSLAAVWFTTLPTAGELKWNGSTFAAGNYVMAGDIDAGLLVYTPPADASGAAYASFTFQVQDDGGTANGGVDIDASPNTITVDIAPVNDAPVLDTLPDIALTTQNEDSGTPVGLVGTSISSLVDLPGSGGSLDNVTDADAGAITGIAITAVDTTYGSWWFTTDAGANWNTLGTVSAANARLLAADADTLIYFEPNPDYNGTIPAALSFRAWDQTSGSNGGVADTTANGGQTAFSTAVEQCNLVIAPVGDPPTIGGVDTGSVTEDVDPDLDTLLETGGALTISDPDVGESAFQPGTVTGTYGDLTIDASGNWTYAADNTQAAIQQLDAGESVSDVLTVTTADGTTHAITITINGAEDAPVITGTTTGSVTEDGTLVASGALSISDVDTSDNPIGFPDEASTPGDNGYGDFALVGGTWTYTLNNGHPAVQALDAGETLTDTHTFLASDGSMQVVTITVNGAEDAPVITGTTTGSVTEDGTLTATGALSISDVDTSDNPISFPDEASTPGDNGYGDFALVGGTWTYTLNNAHPAVQALDAGETLTDTHAFLASDGSMQVVTITVNGAEDAPVVANAIADQAATEDVAFTFTFAANTFSDVDTSDTLTYTATLADASPLPAWLVFDGATRTFSGTPANADVGTISVKVTADDGTSTVSDTFDIAVANVNDAPVAADDSYTGTEDQLLVVPAAGVLANDTDVDSSTLSAVLLTGPANGALTLNADGSFSYQPAPDFFGTDAFTYKVNDGSLDSNVATVTLTIAPVNDDPVANADTLFADEDTGQTVAAPGLLGNDTDAEGTAGLYVSAVDGSSTAVGVATLLPSGALVTVNADGSVLYDTNGAFESLAAGATGTDSFTYTITDAGGLTSTASVDVFIAGVNDSPVAANDAYVIDEDTTLAAALGVNDLLLNDSDVDLDTLTVNTTPVSGPANGALTLNADGTFVYTPNADFNGSDGFVYEVQDQNGAAAQAVVTITVNAVNDAPVIGSDGGGAVAALTLVENGTAVTTVGATDVDSPPAALFYSLVGGADSALFSIDSATGVLSIAAGIDFEAPVDSDANNVYQVVVAANDGAGGVDTQTITLAITDLDEFDVSAIADINSAIDVVAPTASAGSPVGLTAYAFDADGTNNAIVYSLDDDAGGRFSIDPVSGVVRVATALDASTQGSLGLIVRATSADGSFSTRAFTVTVDAVLPNVPGDPTGGDPLPLPGEVPTGLPNDPGDDGTDGTAQVRVVSEGTPGGSDRSGGTDGSVLGDAVPAPVELDDSSGEVLRDSGAHRMSNASALKPGLSAAQILVQMVSPGNDTADGQPSEAAHADDDLRAALDRVSAELDTAADREARSIEVSDSITIGLTVSLTAGFVSWVLRAGSLLASFMSVAPLWKDMDLIPILGKGRKAAREDDEETPQDADSRGSDDKRVERIFDD